MSGSLGQLWGANGAEDEPDLYGDWCAFDNRTRGVSLRRMALAAERFITEKPSPLTVVDRGKRDATITRFAGTVELSGSFLVAWETVNQKRHFLRIIFIPDSPSTAMLPHAAGTSPVKEVMLSNSEQAASMLLTPQTAQKVLAGELLRAEGKATVTITGYQAVIECDHRWHIAQLVSATNSRDAVAASTDNRRLGCWSDWALKKISCTQGREV
jgi:hypothetical protein